MFFGRIISIVLAMVAVVGVFVQLPIVSDYAFWILVGALFVWWMAHPISKKNRFKMWFMLTIVLLLIAIVSVFVEIPIISDYAFWVLLVAYFIALSDVGWEKA